MTTGQRIAAKRKELELSQESLGEALGVSRQSIYKWESDTSLPDIDKLVALSRLFHVSVGWLLGVEEEQPEAPSPETGSGELSDAQLRMVEEIVDRYLAAQPKPKKRRLWPYVLAALAVLYIGLRLMDRLDRMDNQYNNLSNSINNITYSVDRQINTITNRVEEILKSQNDLTADYGTEMTGWDLSRNTVTFSLRVVPKTYVDGMEVVFLADSGDGPAEFPAQEGPGRAFTGEITCELTDSITLSAVFVNGDTRQTQLLDNYSGLYQESMPQLDISGLEGCFLNLERDKDGMFHLPESYGWLRDQKPDTKFGAVEVRDLKVGLFKNFQLVTWLEPCEQPKNWNVDGEQFFRFDAMDMELGRGDILHFAAIFTDQYGRQGVAPGIPYFECFGDELSWPGSSDGTPYYDFSNYVF